MGDGVVAQRQDSEAVEIACRDWRANGCHSGEGNDRFFKLGLKLARAGLQEPELESALVAEVVYASTPKDRLRQVPSIVESLKRYRHLAS